MGVRRDREEKTRSAPRERSREKKLAFAFFARKRSILVKADKTREKPNRFLSGITVDFFVGIGYNKGS